MCGVDLGPFLWWIMKIDMLVVERMWVHLSCYRDLSNNQLSGEVPEGALLRFNISS
jgi:hypothetical protein